MDTQCKKWSGKFGKEYTNRSSWFDDGEFNFNDWNNITFKEFGVLRTEINNHFFGNINADVVLEVGANIGAQLNCFEKMKLFPKIYGLELQRYAISRSRKIFPAATFDIVQGVAEDIPFKDTFFDLVITNGLLVHISPDNINNVLDEIHRCSSRYIFGCEYYDNQYTHVNYRGSDDLLWRGDFPSMYLNKFSDLRIAKRKKFVDVTDNSLMYDVYLLEKII